MKIFITLEEILERCSDWEDFCEKEGFSEWCVNEGGGDIEICLSEEKAIEYGILNFYGR
jgi:hypothetical protein